MAEKRILIIKPSALGDIAAALPLLADLRHALPDAKIDWLVQPAFLPLLQEHKLLHQPILFDRKRLSAWWWNPAACFRLLRLFRTLRSLHYDIVIDAQGLLRSGIFTRITGAKMRIGFAGAREGARHAYTHSVALPAEGTRMPAVDRMRALLKPLGISGDTPAEFGLQLPAAAEKSADQLLAGRTDFIAVVPGARWATKRWPMARYVELVRKLLAAGETVVLIGSPDEKPLCDAIAQGAGISAGGSKSGAIINLGGRTLVAVMAALLSRAKLVIGNDSGPLHVAVALGKQVVGLYGPTPPEFVGPYGQLQNVLRHDVECHPCRRKTCDHHSCMNGLKVELVWEKTTKSISSISSNSPRAGL